MQKLPVSFVLLAKHKFVHKAVYEAFSSSYLRGYLSNSVLDNIRRDQPVIYKHTCLYALMLKNIKGEYVTTVWTASSRSKEMAFLFHKIVRNKNEAVLHIKDPNQDIQKLARLKITMFPDVAIKIIHHYENKIPKKHLMKSISEHLKSVNKQYKNVDEDFESDSFFKTFFK